MTQQTRKKIQPYPAEDGEYTDLVEFALEAAQLLDRSYKPVGTYSEKVTETLPHESDTNTFFYGEEPTNIKVLYKIGYESIAYGHAVDEVIVICNGLPQGMHLELQVLRDYSNPRFIEIRATGPEEVINLILERFENRFGI